MIDSSALDDPVGEALRSRHLHLSRRVGQAVTYLPEVATFVAVEGDPSSARTWNDVAELLGPGGFADMFSATATPPPHWEPVFEVAGRQMVGPEASGRCRALGVRGDIVDRGGRDDIVDLGVRDVPEMLELTALTTPGPFGPRTHELGTYIGVRENGVLVAMAGERLRPPGWTEISAVCTRAESRGRGYASRLVDELVSRILARGDRPFLHTVDENVGAIALYERLGFTTRTHVTFRGFRVPS